MALFLASSMTVVTCGTTTPAMIAIAATTISISISVKPARGRSAAAREFRRAKKQPACIAPP